MAPTDGKQVADEVVPVVDLGGGTHQKSAARIDRRPHIFLDHKQKYVVVKATLSTVDYRFTDDAVKSFRTLNRKYHERARNQPDNKGGVDLTMTSGFSGRTRSHQRVEFDGLFETDAHDLIEELIPLVSDPTNWTRDDESVNSRMLTGIGDERAIPRPGAPDLERQDDGLARHVPLADKSISYGQITAYVSTQAYRHGEALVDGGRIRPNQHGDHGCDADGYDVKTNVGFELEFENGEIIDHDCWCDSTLNPCEHIAGLLLALPDVAECYV
jgi:hypothetical protein